MAKFDFDKDVTVEETSRNVPESEGGGSHQVIRVTIKNAPRGTKDLHVFIGHAKDGTREGNPNGSNLRPWAPNGWGNNIVEDPPGSGDYYMAFGVNMLSHSELDESETSVEIEVKSGDKIPMDFFKDRDKSKEKEKKKKHVKLSQGGFTMKDGKAVFEPLKLKTEPPSRPKGARSPKRRGSAVPASERPGDRVSAPTRSSSVNRRRSGNIANKPLG